MATTTLDTTLVLTGFAGELYDSNGTFIAECNTWHVSLPITNTEYQPGGSALKRKIMTSYAQMLTLNETVFSDVRFLQPILLALAAQKQAFFNFSGKLVRSDGSFGYYPLYNCVPDGSVDLANVAPGDVLTRAWSFGINTPIKATALLGGAQSGL